MRSRRVSVGRGGSGRILIAIVVALFAIASYYFGTTQVENPVTGEVQRVNMSPQDEIMMGLQAAPEMEQQFGGPHPDEQAQALVDRIGQEIVAKLPRPTPRMSMSFTSWREPETINAFALPGGQIFITAALFNRLERKGSWPAFWATKWDWRRPVMPPNGLRKPS